MKSLLKLKKGLGKKYYPEILIKVVAQAISTYAMSCFQLPKGQCEEMEEMMRRFWWAQHHQESKIAYVSWKKMCKSELRGGLGF